MVHPIESDTFILFHLSIRPLIPVPLQFKKTALHELGCQLLYLRQGSAWASFTGTWPVWLLRALCSKRPCWVYCPTITTLKFIIIFEQGAMHFHFALKVKLQYFGHLTWRADSGKDTDAGKD